MRTIATLLVLLGLAGAAGAEEMAGRGDIAVHDAYATATLGQATTSAAYMTLINTGAEADHLVGAASPVAAAVEPHSHVIEGGVMRMRPVEVIEVAPGAPTVLQPGGLHLMLIGLNEPLREGEAVPLTLTFERAGTVELALPVRPLGGLPPRDHHHGHGGAATN